MLKGGTGIDQLGLTLDLKDGTGIGQLGPSLDLKGGTGIDQLGLSLDLKGGIGIGHLDCFRGPALIEYLDHLSLTNSSQDADKPVRMPIVDRYK
jgi:hypothetical protein